MYDEILDNTICEFQRIKSCDGKVYNDYFINKQGVVINCKRRTLRVMKPKISDWGYYSIGLRDDDGERIYYFIHKLVAKTFIPNPKGNKKQINHIDGNKLNNNVENLEWCTQSENTQHAFDTGLIKNILKPYKLYYKGNFINDFSKKKDMVEYLQIQTGLSFDHIRKCISHERLITEKSLLNHYTFEEI